MRKLILLVALATAASLAARAALPPANLGRTLAAQQALVDREPTAERYNDLGNLLLLADRRDDARAAYQEAIALDETLVSGHYNLGLLLHGDGERRTALRHFRRVVDLQPGHARAWFQIGLLHEQSGAQGAAVRSYARAYSLEPRLSFPDENPQVLDSALTTRALLLAGKEVSTAAEAPRAYEEGRRIASLLLPAPPPTEAVAAATPEPTRDPATAGREPAARPPSAGVPILPLPGEEQAAGGREGRVLGPQDLQPGSRVGEVTTAPGVQGRVTHLPQQEEAADYGELLRQRLMQQREMQQHQFDEGGEVVESPYYVPGPRSTGQLEQRLEDQLAALDPGVPPAGR